jgi:hypothetical protein
VGLFSEREDAVPVVLIHGWPGLFLLSQSPLSLTHSVFHNEANERKY